MLLKHNNGPGHLSEGFFKMINNSNVGFVTCKMKLYSGFKIMRSSLQIL